jgi:2-dehydro-3-deoxyphosphogluconate aldolase / (4S)-4-hydroxy-2-oxoglutarate aldolase
MTHHTVASVLNTLQARRVVAVVRAPSPKLALEAASVLIDNGITGIEITFTTPDAAGAIEKCVARHGEEALIGAGTILTTDQVASASQAGADFLVSPGTDGDLADAMVNTGLATMTGVLSPTEIMKAISHGVHVMKVFPGSLGGPGYLGALKGPFPDLRFMPTGGVSAKNLGDWLSQGAFAVGAGGDLVPSRALAVGDFDDIQERARAYVAALAEFDRDKDNG